MFEKLGTRLDEEELIELMNEIDSNKDGVVDIDEFCDLIAVLYI